VDGEEIIYYHPVDILFGCFGGYGVFLSWRFSWISLWVWNSTEDKYHGAAAKKIKQWKGWDTRKMNQWH